MLYITHPVVKLSFPISNCDRASRLERNWDVLKLVSFSPLADLDSLKRIPVFPKLKQGGGKSVSWFVQAAAIKIPNPVEILDLGSEIGFEIDTLRLEFPVWKYTVEESQAKSNLV